LEFFHEYAEPPNLFYPLQVKRIRKVTLPIEFVTPHVPAVGHPTRLRGDQYAAGDVWIFIPSAVHINLDDR